MREEAGAAGSHATAVSVVRAYAKQGEEFREALSLVTTESARIPHRPGARGGRVAPSTAAADAASESPKGAAASVACRAAGGGGHGVG